MELNNCSEINMASCNDNFDIEIKSELNSKKFGKWTDIDVKILYKPHKLYSIFYILY